MGAVLNALLCPVRLARIGRKHMNAMTPDRRGLLRGALAVAAVGAMSRSQAFLRSLWCRMQSLVFRTSARPADRPITKRLSRRCRRPSMAT